VRLQIYVAVALIVRVSTTPPLQENSCLHRDKSLSMKPKAALFFSRQVLVVPGAFGFCLLLSGGSGSPNSQRAKNVACFTHSDIQQAGRHYHLVS